MSKSMYQYLRGTYISASNNQRLDSATGTFKYETKVPRNISIKPISSRIGGVGDVLFRITNRAGITVLLKINSKL